jgi:hypothetical protein
MIYVEYEQAKVLYEIAKKDYESLIDRQQEIRAKYQSITTHYKEVSGGQMVNAIEEYITQKDIILKEIEEAEAILKERKNILNLKLAELKQSYDWADKIYYKRYIEHTKVKRLEIELPLSRRTIYRIIKEIQTKIRENQKGGQDNGNKC